MNTNELFGEDGSLQTACSTNESTVINPTLALSILESYTSGLKSFFQANLKALLTRYSLPSLDPVQIPRMPPDRIFLPSVCSLRWIMHALSESCAFLKCSQTTSSARNWSFHRSYCPHNSPMLFVKLHARWEHVSELSSFRLLNFTALLWPMKAEPVLPLATRRSGMAPFLKDRACTLNALNLASVHHFFSHKMSRPLLESSLPSSRRASPLSNLLLSKSFDPINWRTMSTIFSGFANTK